MSRTLVHYQPSGWLSEWSDTDPFSQDTIGPIVTRMDQKSLVQFTVTAINMWNWTLSAAHLMRTAGKQGHVIMEHLYPSGLAFDIRAMTFQEYCDGDWASINAPDELTWKVNLVDPSHPNYVDPANIASNCNELDPTLGITAQDIVELAGMAGGERLPFMLSPNVQYDYAFPSTAQVSTFRHRCGFLNDTRDTGYLEAKLTSAGFTSIEAPFATMSPTDVPTSTLEMNPRMNVFSNSVNYALWESFEIAINSAYAGQRTRAHVIAQESGFHNIHRECWESLLVRAINGEDDEIPYLDYDVSGAEDMFNLIFVEPTEAFGFHHHTREVDADESPEVKNPLGVDDGSCVQWMQIMIGTGGVTTPGKQFPFVVPALHHERNPTFDIRRNHVLMHREMPRTVNPAASVGGPSLNRGVLSEPWLSNALMSGEFTATNVDDPWVVKEDDSFSLSDSEGFALLLPALEGYDIVAEYLDMYPVDLAWANYVRTLTRMGYSNARSMPQGLFALDTSIDNLDMAVEAKPFCKGILYTTDADAIAVVGTRTTDSISTAITPVVDCFLPIQFDGTLLFQNVGTYTEHYDWQSVADGGVFRMIGANIPGSAPSTTLWYCQKLSGIISGDDFLRTQEDGGAVSLLAGTMPLGFAGTLVSELNSGYVKDNSLTLLPSGQGFHAWIIPVAMLPICGLNVTYTSNTEP